MAGMPKRRAAVQRMRERGGWRWFLEQVANGRTMLDIAAEIQTSRYHLYQLVYKTERSRQSYRLARRIGADARIEAAEARVNRDDKDDSRVKVARDQLRAEFSKYLAAVDNPEVYGKKEAGITVNIAELHLDALRNRVVEATDVIVENNRQALPPAYRKQEILVEKTEQP
jgi:HD superfamily phosphohydrolase